MIFNLDKNGNVISSDTSDTLIQGSINANVLQVKFDELDLTEYVPFVAFERADGKVSPLIPMSYNGEYVEYGFSDSWITAKSGLLKVAITLKQNNIVKKTANFSLNVAETIQEDMINYIDDVMYNELVNRLYNSEISLSQKLDKRGGTMTGAIDFSNGFENTYINAGSIFIKTDGGQEAFIGNDDGEQLTVATPKLTTHNIDARNEFNEPFVIDGGYGVFEIDFINNKIKLADKVYAKEEYVESYVDDVVNTASTQTKAYTDAKIKELIGTAPETLDTIYEVAKAIKENEDVVEKLDETISQKADTNYVNIKYDELVRLINKISGGGSTIASVLNDMLTLYNASVVDDTLILYGVIVNGSTLII